MNKPDGTITLIGSGEFGEGMGRVYRAILARAPSEPVAVFLDTPAGFQVNADAMAAKAAEYFSQRLNLALETASFKNKARARAVELEAALRVLRRADLMFAGPGSPSYAIRNWKDTPVWDTVLDRFHRGAQLVFASAAAIAMSAYALPVYEIYKAGHDLFWLDGMNLFGELGMLLAVVPHWNNAEGGTYDTRFCYMGKARFLELERLLPRDTVVLGIDEYTACLFDLATETCQVMGAGGVTLWREGQALRFATGESFEFAQLRSSAQALAQVAAPKTTTIPGREYDETTRYLLQVARALGETQEPEQQRDLIERAHDTMHELAAERMEDAHRAPQSDIAPYLETLIEIRKQLRSAKQYALADEIRERLAEVNIVLEDSADGTTWRKA